MLDDIRLTPVQLAVLESAAGTAGGRLDPDYLGEFRPGNSPRCVALFAASPGALMMFAVAAAVLDHELLPPLASRVCEDYPGNDASRVYYWPGIICPEVAGQVPAEFGREQALRAFTRPGTGS